MKIKFKCIHTIKFHKIIKKNKIYYEGISVEINYNIILLTLDSVGTLSLVCMLVILFHLMLGHKSLYNDFPLKIKGHCSSNSEVTHTFKRV